MPKKKNRRKKGKKANKLKVVSSSKTSTDATNSELPKAKTVQPSQSSIMKFLYRDDAEGLKRLVRFLPLFSGAWISGGLILDQVWNFVLVTAVMILAYFCAHPEKRSDFIFSEIIDWILVAIIFGLLLFLNMLTNQPMFTCIAAGVAVLIWLSERIEINSPRALLLLCAERIVEMSLFSFLSVYSQTLTGEINWNLQFYWEYCVIGFVPACCLAASFIPLHIKVLYDAGWSKTRVSNKSETTRPGGIAQLYSLLLIVGPALPVVLVPLNKFPAPFLLLAFSAIAIPKLCQSFFDDDSPDGMVYIRTLNLGVLVSCLVLLAAILSNVFA